MKKATYFKVKYALHEFLHPQTHYLLAYKEKHFYFQLLFT